MQHEDIPGKPNYYTINVARFGWWRQSFLSVEKTGENVDTSVAFMRLDSIFQHFVGALVVYHWLR